MDQVAELLAQYPFDVLLGSVHWVGAWRFDDLSDPPSLREWSVRAVDDCWDAYTGALEELAATRSCDVLAHPDLVKVAGHVPGQPAEWWDRIAEAAVATGEQYPARGLLDRFAARGVPFTTASDAHRLDHVADRADDLRALLAAVGVGRLRAFRRRVPTTVAVGG
jgi:histidinol-phosphatase (PHP family)